MPDVPEIPQAWIDLALRLAQESGALINRFFAQGVAASLKPDRSPVTEADKQAEALMRRILHAECPQHRVLGEEEGTSGPAGAPWRWVLDPIDGTRSFVCGVPLFGTLIALQHEERSVLGLIHLSAQKQLLLGLRGRSTTLNGVPVRVRQQHSLNQAVLLYTDWPDLQRHGLDAPLLALARQGALLRGWGDCYGHFLVASGQADAMLDPTLNLWDVAALLPCISAAGGSITDLQGQPEPQASAISSNGVLHQPLLEALRKSSS